MRTGLIALALLSLFAGGCTTTRIFEAEQQRGAEAPLGNGLVLTLPLEPGGPRFSAMQTVSAQYGEVRGVFQAVLQVNPQTANIVITAAEGPRLVTINWDRAGVREERTVFAPESVKGINVLSDIFVSVWPIAAVRAAMPPGVTVTETDRLRQVKQGDHVILEVETQLRNSRQLRQELRSLDNGYTLRVTTEFDR